jgi:hypothetical protein
LAAPGPGALAALWAHARAALHFPRPVEEGS